MECDSWQRVLGNPVWQHGTRPSFPSSATHEKVTHRDLAVEIKFLSRLLSDRRNLQKLMKGMHPFLLQRELEAHLTKPRVLRIIDHTREAYFWPLVMKIFLLHPKHMALLAWPGCWVLGDNICWQDEHKVARKGYGKERLRNSSLLTETGRRVWWLKRIPFWNAFLSKARKCFQESASRTGAWNTRGLYFSLLITSAVTKTLGFSSKRLNSQRWELLLPLNCKAIGASTVRPHFSFFSIENKTLKNHSEITAGS